MFDDAAKPILRKLRLKYMAAGCSRYVYTSKDFSNVVIKICSFPSNSYNVSEYAAYKNATYEEKKLLAMPLGISANGRVLAMTKLETKYVTPTTKLKNFLKKLEKTKVGKKTDDRYDLSELKCDIEEYGRTKKVYVHNIGFDKKLRAFKLYDYPVG